MHPGQVSRADDDRDEPICLHAAFPEVTGIGSPGYQDRNGHRAGQRFLDHLLHRQEQIGIESGGDPGLLRLLDRFDPDSTRIEQVFSHDLLELFEELGRIDVGKNAAVDGRLGAGGDDIHLGRISHPGRHGGQGAGVSLDGVGELVGNRFLQALEDLLDHGIPGRGEAVDRKAGESLNDGVDRIVIVQALGSRWSPRRGRG